MIRDCFGGVRRSTRQHRLLWAAMLMACCGGTLAGLVLSVERARAEQQLIEVTDVAWTNGVLDHQCIRRFAGRAPCRPLYFWVRISGKQQALDILEAEGKLPIRHKWFRLVAGMESWEGTPELKDEINLSIGRREKLNKLQVELGSRTFFDWRTWSMKENLRPGRWGVRMVYATDEPVKCGLNGQDCAWVIEVR